MENKNQENVIWDAYQRIKTKIWEDYKDRDKIDRIDLLLENFHWCLRKHFIYDELKYITNKVFFINSLDKSIKTLDEYFTVSEEEKALFNSYKFSINTDKLESLIDNYIMELSNFDSIYIYSLEGKITHNNLRANFMIDFFKLCIIHQ